MYPKTVALVSSFLNNYTTATYFAEVFENQGIRYKKFHPREQSKIGHDFDLIFYVDDGTEYVIKPREDILKVLYLIDTHMGIEDDRFMYHHADLIFCAQKNAVSKIQKYNSHVYWLPLACSKKLHYVETKPKKYDLGFIGAPGFGERARLYNLLKLKYPNSYFGSAERDKIGSIYAASKIVFNHSINNDINMRFFEAMCSGSLLLTDVIRDNGMVELQSSQKELFFQCFDGEADLLQKIEYFLAEQNDQERETVAKRGQAFAFENTYTNRWEKIVSTLQNVSIKKTSKMMYYVDVISLLVLKVRNKVNQMYHRSKHASTT